MHIRTRIISMIRYHLFKIKQNISAGSKLRKLDSLRTQLKTDKGRKGNQIAIMRTVSVLSNEDKS